MLLLPEERTGTYDKHYIERLVDFIAHFWSR